MDNVTLLVALQSGGGPGVEGGAQILFKQAVAAILNARHPDVDYALSSSDIMDGVNDALASGERSKLGSLGGVLDGYNNASCPEGLGANSTSSAPPGDKGKGNGKSVG